MSKRGYERKIREEQEATAHVFQEFINTFQDVATTSKTFIKSGVLYSDKSQMKPLEGQVYNPKPVIKNTTVMKNILECAKIIKESKLEKSKRHEKPKSNLEMLKEELKQRHSERDERERLKEEFAMAAPALSYFDGGDPNSTNLFVANLNTNVTEAVLMEEFGLFGPLASVKIMWPRGEDKFKNSNTNCGFVAYMSRRDAERALNHMKHRTDMRVGWGKSVELPAHPVYIPQELLRLYLPPPQSGLPFNAQPNMKENLDDNQDVDAALFDSVVKVTIPLNKKVLTLVNRMVEFVIKEGPLFEAMIMNNELCNPDYNFLFDNKSPIHVYYRWKLFSILQGETTKHWSRKPFRMFKGGSIWLPPVAPDYSQGMPDELIKIKDDESLLSDNQCERFIDLIHNLSLSRVVIAEAMVFCINHLSAINDLFKILVGSLCNPGTNPVSKIARLYLLSDILSNCSNSKVTITHLQSNLDKVIDHLCICFENLVEDADRQIFKYKVMRVVHQLDSLGVLAQELFKKIESYFNKNNNTDDGNSSSDEPLDGASLRKRSLKNSSQECIITPTSLKRKKTEEIPKEYFVTSKWDTLDPEEVEAQAMSSTKLYYMEAIDDLSKNKGHETVSTEPSSFSPPKTKESGKKKKSQKSDSWCKISGHYSRNRDKRKKSHKN